MTDIQSSLSQANQLLSENSDSPMLDAEVLLCHVLDKDRSHLKAWPEKQLQPEQLARFSQLISQRQQGAPVAYLTGSREFWSRDFKVSPAVLIPRPDTELLIELSLDLLSTKSNPKIIDLGTGSGIIAITLAAERPDLEVVATDLSKEALAIARQNAINYQIQNIQFIHSSWFNNVSASKFDLIISNPPYIAANDPHLSEGDVRFEPDSALIAENNGLKDIQNIADNARQYLNKKGSLLIEHGCDQEKEVQSLFKAFDYSNIKTHNDLSGNPRVTTAQWNAE